MRHELKTDAGYFEEIKQGRKTFEVRSEADRTFAAGDIVVLRETRHTGMEMLNAGAPLVYTGREFSFRAGYIMRGPVFGLSVGLVIISIA